MARLSCIGLICITLCAGGITLARQIGQSHALPLAAIFTTPDGTPCPEVCLFGAQPGKTTYQEAILLLQQHSVTRTLRRRESGNELLSIFESESADFDVEIAKSQDSDVLAWIVLMNTNPNLQQVSSGTGTLGQMISLLGPPTAVDADDLVLTDAYYAADRIILSATRAGSGASVPIGVNNAVVSITRYAPGQLENVTGVSNLQVLPWRGFRQSGRYYWDAPSIIFSP